MFEKFLDKLRYYIYKARLMRIARNSDPLFSYPFVMFLKLNLDKIYKEKGFEGAVEAAEEWPSGYGNNLEKVFSKVTKEGK